MDLVWLAKAVGLYVGGVLLLALISSLSMALVGVLMVLAAVYYDSLSAFSERLEPSYLKKSTGA